VAPPPVLNVDPQNIQHVPTSKVVTNGEASNVYDTNRHFKTPKATDDVVVQSLLAESKIAMLPDAQNAKIWQNENQRNEILQGKEEITKFAEPLDTAHFVRILTNTVVSAADVIKEKLFIETDNIANIPTAVHPNTLAHTGGISSEQSSIHLRGTNIHPGGITAAIPAVVPPIALAQTGGTSSKQSNIHSGGTEYTQFTSVVQKTADASSNMEVSGIADARGPAKADPEVAVSITAPNPVVDTSPFTNVTREKVHGSFPKSSIINAEVNWKIIPNKIDNSATYAKDQTREDSGKKYCDQDKKPKICPYDTVTRVCMLTSSTFNWLDKSSECQYPFISNLVTLKAAQKSQTKRNINTVKLSDSDSTVKLSYSQTNKLPPPTVHDIVKTTADARLSLPVYGSLSSSFSVEKPLNGKDDDSISVKFVEIHTIDPIARLLDDSKLSTNTQRKLIRPIPDTNEVNDIQNSIHVAQSKTVNININYLDSLKSASQTFPTGGKFHSDPLDSPKTETFVTPSEPNSNTASNGSDDIQSKSLNDITLSAINSSNPFTGLNENHNTSASADDWRVTGLGDASLQTSANKVGNKDVSKLDKPDNADAVMPDNADKIDRLEVQMLKLENRLLRATFNEVISTL